MFTKTNHWILAGIAILFVVAFTMLNMPEQASAAPTSMNSTDNSCLSCHEDLYQLHDTGCWYCMIEPHRERCTDCHEGNAASFRAEEAHIGLLPHPQENNGEKCKQCHTEDVQAQLDKFASEVGGFKPVVQTVAYTPVHPVEVEFPETAQPGIAEKLPWVAGGVVLFGFWLALVLLSPKKP